MEHITGIGLTVGFILAAVVFALRKAYVWKCDSVFERRTAKEKYDNYLRNFPLNKISLYLYGKTFPATSEEILLISSYVERNYTMINHLSDKFSKLQERINTLEKKLAAKENNENKSASRRRKPS